VAAINNSTSRSAALLPLIQEWFWWTVANNFKISSSYIPGKLNVLSDSLSRLHEPASALYAKALLTNGSLETVLCKDHMSHDSFVFLQSIWSRTWLNCFCSILSLTYTNLAITESLSQYRSSSSKICQTTLKSLTSLYLLDTD
jgi:hypothetical protein